MSKLDQYISKLMHDDDALKHFLVDPITAAEDKNGLTKAERSVLRRVVAGISNNATNGFSIVRHLDSYRRSLRLLQNVLHKHQGSHPANFAANIANVEGGTTYNFSVFLYYPPQVMNPWPVPVPGAYSNYLLFTGSFTTSDGTVTVKQVMDSVTENGAGATTLTSLANIVTGVHGEPIVSAFNINGANYKAIPGDPNQGSHNPFWFYSFNGTARPGAPYYGNYYGTFETGSSQTGLNQNVPLQPAGTANVMFWQLIAPEQSYGFDSCVTTSVEQAFKA